MGLAVAYPLALLAVIAALRGIGERWSVTTLALYLPRAGFGLPLPILTLALLFIRPRPRRWLLTQVFAAILVLFPLMGLVLPVGRGAHAGAAHLRLMSFNVDLAPADRTALVDAVRRVDADVVCLQEVRGDEAPALALALPQHVVRQDGQFVIASRYPIVDVDRPPRRVGEGERFDPSFARYRLQTPEGLVDVYDIHPLSPHGPFDKLRGAGLLHELATGRFFRNADGFERLAENAHVRALQVGALAQHAAASPYPVLIAGDTNLPAGSRILRGALGAYQDGFVEAGRGFGYTYPARRAPPWLRIDRVLADAHFRFVSFRRLDVHISTHLPVVAEVEWTPDGARRAAPDGR